MDIETLMWGIVPAVVGCMAIVASIMALIRHFSISQLLMAILVFVLAGGSLFMLKQMFFDGAWPTYVPHYAIGLAAPLALGQLLLRFRRAAQSPSQS